MTTYTRPPNSCHSEDDTATTPVRQQRERVSGDELFVPASHVLITDRQVSHPAFRLWCVLHRLWFLHEPPTMELLQEMMGAAVEQKGAPTANGSRSKTGQPATRRSIERWLTELETAGWLIWTRREETTRRYHLRTSARSATDTAVLTELRTLLNSSKATLADVQALLNTAPGLRDDATLPSHDSIPGSHEDAVAGAELRDDATSGSHGPAIVGKDATAESQDPILGSHDTTSESQDTTLGSYSATVESQDTTQGSCEWLTQGALVRKNGLPYIEILQNEIHEDPPPSPAAPAVPGGGGGGPTATERYLLRHGFSTRAAREFRDLDVTAVQTDLERRHALGQGIGAIVTTWRVEPPQPVATQPDELSVIARRVASAKAQALAIAPPNASPLEIQYLALDLEEGTPPEAALANLVARRTTALEGYVT